MKSWIACACAVALLGACGISKEATAALDAMNLSDGSTGMVKYASKSGSGSKITLTDVEISDGKDGDEGMKAASAVLEGLTVDAEGKPSFTAITLNDVSPLEDVPGLTFNLASWSMTGLNEATGAYMAKTLADGEPGEPLSFEQWGVGTAKLSGLTIVADLDEMGAGGGAVNITLDEVSFANLEDSIIGAFGWHGFKGDFDVPQEATGAFPVKGSFDFGTLSIKNVQGQLYSGMFAAMANPMMAAEAQTEMLQNMTSPLEPGYDDVEWSGMNLTAAGLIFDISKVSADIQRNGDGVVTKVSAPRTTMKLSIDSENGGMLGSQAAMALGMVGYQELELYAEGDATFDPATDVTRYDNYKIGITDAFDLNISGGFNGFKEALVAMSSMSGSMGGYGSEPDLSGFEMLKVIDLEFSLSDRSLTDKLFNLAPMFTGQDVESLRADIVDMMSSMGADLADAGIDPAISNELTSAVAQFVEKPGTISIKLKPDQPVSFANPSGELTKDALGFSATYSAN